MKQMPGAPSGRVPEALKEKRQADSEDGCKGDKEAIPEGGHLVPVGIARDHIIKRGGAHAQIGRDPLGGTRRKRKANEGKSENWVQVMSPCSEETSTKRQLGAVQSQATLE